MDVISRIVRCLIGYTSAMLLAGIALSLTLAVAIQWNAIYEFDWRLSWFPFVGAVALFSLGPLVGALCFWIVLRDLTPRAGLGPSMIVWERSFAARYIPSGALAVAVRLHERRRLGASRAQMVSATVFEQGVAIAGAASVSVAALTASDGAPPAIAVAVLVVVVGLAVAARPIAIWWTRRRARQLGARDQLVARSRTLVAAVLLCTCGWLVAGAAAWIFIGSLTIGAPPAFSFLLGAYSLAWLVGFVVPIAPSGLGAREATFVALLAPVVGVAPATGLSVGLRLANVAGDFVAIAGIEAAQFAGRSWRRAHRTRSVVLRVS